MVDSKVEQAKQLLTQISTDKSVPKNIRKAASEAYTSITEPREEDDLELRANEAISILDEISQDPNCPMYARTTIWNVLSVLETIKTDS